MVPAHQTALHPRGGLKDAFHGMAQERGEAFVRASVQKATKHANEFLWAARPLAVACRHSPQVCSFWPLDYTEREYAET